MLEAAIEALQRGAVIGVPTDTVYGLAVDPANAEAVSGLFELKGRPDSAPLVVLAASLAAVERLVDATVQEQMLLAGHWPGALTAILPTNTQLAPGVGDPDTETLAVRVPDHAELLVLLELYGPLAVTSANRSGGGPAESAEQARAVFGPAVVVYLDGSRGAGLPSTIVDLTVDPHRIVRQGSVRL